MGSTLAQAREDARAVSWGLCSGVALWESPLFFISYFLSLVSLPSLLTQPKILKRIKESTFNHFPSLPIEKGWWRGGRNPPWILPFHSMLYFWGNITFIKMSSFLAISIWSNSNLEGEAPSFPLLWVKYSWAVDANIPIWAQRPLLHKHSTLFQIPQTSLFQVGHYIMAFVFSHSQEGPGECVVTPCQCRLPLQSLLWSSHLGGTLLLDVIQLRAVLISATKIPSSNTACIVPSGILQVQALGSLSHSPRCLQGIPTTSPCPAQHHSDREENNTA